MKLLEELSPKQYAEDWDNVGLLVGRDDKEVEHIMLALDATDEVIEQAIREKVDMLITHHPLIFKPMKSVTTGDFIGRRVYHLIANDISYYAMHTNFDVKGMAEAAANKIGLLNTKVLDPIKVEKLYKVVVYVPVEDAEKVREAMTLAGAGHIGDYSDCTFNIEGIGTYMPLEGTNPYIGTINQLERTKETRIETIIGENGLNRVIESMLNVHPYEEPAYDIYELKLDGRVDGIGRVGNLEHNLTLKECGELVKKSFDLDHVRIIGDLGKDINKIAISTGSGESLIKYALKEKADVLITGDIGHHAGIDALARELCIIDAGHFGTEHFMTEFVKDYLEKRIQGVESIESKENNGYIKISIAKESNPFQIL